MRTISVFLLIVLGCSNIALAQLQITAFPFSALNTDVRSLSLGNATVSLASGYANHKINPAVVGEEGVLQISPSWQNFSIPTALYRKHRGLYANYRTGNSTIGFSFQGIESSEQKHTRYLDVPYVYKFNNYDVELSGYYSHTFKYGLTIGTGLSFLHSSESSGSSVRAQLVEADNSWAIDVGANYQFPKIEINKFYLKPHIGTVLSNFGSPVYYTNSQIEEPLATTLRVGGGTDIILEKKALGRRIFELSAMQSVSKIMARIERTRTGAGFSFDAMNPFKALFKSWDSLDYNEGAKRKTAHPDEQLWWHSGMELRLLETIALRWGYQKAGELEEELSYRALGAGIDLYYLVFDYTHIKNKKYDNFLEGHNWQITGRIPLDGKRPDTILNKLFD